MRRLVAGIDVGTTTAVALFSLRGKIISVFSLRNPSDEEVLKEMLSWGKPVLLASDVSPVPKRVRSLASSIGASVWEPSYVITVERKREIVKRLGLGKVSSHERDAIAAGYLAYSDIRPKIENLRRRLEYFLGPGFEELVERVLAGEQVARILREGI